MRWMLARPLLKLVREPNSDRLLRVERTIRLLAGQTGSENVSRLADRLMHLAEADIASPREAQKALADLRLILPDTAAIDEAIQSLESFRPRKQPRRAMAGCDEYRGDGHALYFWKTPGKPRPDDLSHKLADGYWALKEAGCPTPVAELSRIFDTVRDQVDHDLPALDRRAIDRRLTPFRKLRTIGESLPWRAAYWREATDRIAPMPRPPLKFTWSAV